MQSYETQPEVYKGQGRGSTEQVEGLPHLCEVDWSVFGNAVSIFASKHSTVTSIHLLWDFLKDQQQHNILQTSSSILYHFPKF